MSRCPFMKVHNGYCMKLWRNLDYAGDPQDAEDAGVVGHLPKKAVDCVWNESSREKYVAANKAERSEEYFDIRHGHAEFGVTPLGFELALVENFLTMLPFLPFGMVMYILCHCMLEVCDPVPLYVGSV